MLIVPFGQDQPDNARRCEQLGVARTLRYDHFATPRVVSELSQLFNDRTYLEQAKKIGKEVEEESGTKKACDAIEQVLHQVEDCSRGQP